jgi:glycosyltransferase involved in cell wall biosynthesis
MPDLTNAIHLPESDMQLASACASRPPDPLGTTLVVSFVIPALNEERRIGPCLQSIERLDLPPGVRGTEVIVVDNCSTDRTAEFSRTQGAVVEQVPPGHPSRARNAGARRATGEWLAFVDADCELPANWLATCGAHLLRDEHVVAAAGSMSGPAGNATWVERAWHEIAHAARPAEPTPVRWLPTFNLLVRRSAFESIGGFDESLSTCEDCDLGYRLAKLGTLIADARTKVVHGGESRSLGELFRREAWRTRGNLRLALSRPFDGLNWLSLLFPPGVVVAWLVAFCGLAAALVAGLPAWPWLSASAILAAAVALLVFRKTAATNPLSLSKQMVVFMTYVSGRAAGLLWSFRRMER